MTLYDLTDTFEDITAEAWLDIALDPPETFEELHQEEHPYKHSLSRVTTWVRRKADGAIFGIRVMRDYNDGIQGPPFEGVSVFRGRAVTRTVYEAE